MSLSSINFQKVNPNSTAHNNRDSKITYLLDHDSCNNQHLFFDDFNDRKLDYINQYKKIHNQKMQKSQVDNIIKEAVVNIEKYHGIDDIKKLFLQLEIELNNFRKERALVFKIENEKLFKCFKPKTINENRIKFNIHEISVHKDEGVFIISDLDIRNLNYDSKNFKWFDNFEDDVTNKIEVIRPSKNIFFNNENKIWYSDSSFEYKFENFDKLQKKYNYHAHIIYSDFDFETAKSARLNSTELSKMQDITAKSLSMQRGVSKKISKVKRFTHGQIKQVSDSIEEEKKLAVNELNHLEKSNQQNIQHATNLLVDTQNKNKILTSQIESLKTELKDLSNRHENEIENLSMRVKSSDLKLDNKIIEIKNINEEYESKVKELQNEIDNKNIEIIKLNILVYSNSICEITGKYKTFKELSEYYKNFNLKIREKYIALVNINKELNHKDTNVIENIKEKYESKVKQQQNEINSKNKEINALNTLVYSNLESKVTGKQYTYKEVYQGHQNSFTSIKSENIELKKEVLALKEREIEIDTKFKEVNSLKKQISLLELQISKSENKEPASKDLEDRKIILENRNYSYKHLQKIMDDEKNKYNNSFNEFKNYIDDDLYDYYDEDNGISPN